MDLAYAHISRSPLIVADWYPRYTEVTQEGTNITVTFNLAPPLLGISSYFFQCYANGRRKYIDISPVSRAFWFLEQRNQDLLKLSRLSLFFLRISLKTKPTTASS